MKLVAVIMLAVAGVIHLYISPGHYAHAPAHGIFFALSGTAQVVWAIAALVRTNRSIYYAGIALSGGMVMLWLLTQVWTPPFAEMAESVGIWTITSKLAEIAGFFALVSFSSRWLGQADLGITRKLVEASVVAAVAGLLFYGGGYAAEPMLPMLQHAGSDAHDNSDGHHDGEADAHAENEETHDNSDGHHDDESSD